VFTAAKPSQHRDGMIRIIGLAQHFAVQAYDGVRGDHEVIAPRANCYRGLLETEPSHQIGRVTIAALVRLIHIGDTYFEGNAKSG